MGAEIDRLEVQVEAQATKANNQLDKLVGKLDRVASSLMNINHGGLSGLANGVNKFALASSQLNNVKTADFTRLAKNIQGLSSIDTQQIYNASSAMTTMAKAMNNLGGVSASSMQVAQVAKDISKLGGKNVQVAITNLPQLAVALKDFMTVMSTAPVVSRNIIQMTDALASLASQGNKVGSATKSASNSLASYGKSATAATKKTKSLASVVGSLYANFWWLRRIADKTWDSMELSMDFLETANYFEVAMRDIGSSAASQWEENGYNSAEAYANSFAERAKQLTEKMTGYSIDENGNASYLGAKSLGMDPDTVMQYQATFAQVSSSIGIAEESALKFSKALTMLGADWASLRNLTFEQGWEKFASALAGQSRAVRSLGIDITNATLQEYAYKYGLEQAVSEMNQATKAQLRLLAILDQSEVAFGDLANTISSPSNQLRMLQQNVNNLGRVFGNLFIPILQKTLPFINGTVIALQNLFSWIGNLMGIEMDSINTSMGGMSDEMYDLVGGAEDYEDALDGANASAKKLKSNLQGFDELNVITTQDDSNSGIGSSNIGGGSVLLDDAITDALADYEKAWNEAFEKMENKAQQYAEKIGKWLEPVKRIIEDFTVGDFFKAGQDTSGLISGILHNLSHGIEKIGDDEAFYDIGQNIVDFICGVDWLGLTWDFGLLSDAITEALGRSGGSFVAGALEGVVDNFLRKPLAELGVEVEIPDLKWLSDLGEIAWSISFPNIGALFSFIEDPKKEVAKFNSILVGFQDSAETAIGNWQELCDEFDKWWEKAVQNWWDNDIAPWFTKEKWQNLGNTAKSGLVSKWNEFEAWWDTTGQPKWWDSVTPWFEEEKWEELGEKAKTGLESKWIQFTSWWESTGLYNWWNNDVEPFFSKEAWTWAGIEDGLSEAWENAIEAVKSIWNKFANWLNDKLNFSWDATTVFGQEIIPAGSINLGKIPTYSTGGFPEDGLFMANRGELVGKFANGRTAVVNNYQIEDGIEEAAYRGVSRALAENGGSNVVIHVDSNASGMFRMWKEEYTRKATAIQKNLIPIY